MRDLDTCVEGFKVQYEKYLVGCDALEEEGRWPKEELGEMDAYFANDVMCAVIRLVAADGRFVQEEVDYLNAALGFAYTVEELEAVYAAQRERIDFLFEKELPRSFERIAALSPPLADTFREMIVCLCGIIVESDGVVTPEERQTAARLQAMLG